MIVFECPVGHQTKAEDAKTVECPVCLRMFKRMRKAGPTKQELKAAGSDPIQRRRDD